MRAWNSAPVPRLPTPASPVRLKVFDSARRSVLPAGPESGSATMYVCGITPYDATHMGHANTYVAFDLLHRVWLDAGLDVSYVQNVTDVDDPLLERATATGVDWVTLAEQQIQLFRDDMTALNVLSPHDYVGAVESIPEILDLITELEQRGSTYTVDDPEFGDLYFAQGSDGDFGFLSQLSESAASALFAERGGDPERPGKKGPLDSLLWRQQRAGEPGWDSPYGRGRPGWHVECAAIALHRLGSDFDVQGGGSDLLFPHHEMSASQAKVATDRPFARLYVHSGMVGLEGEKMSKSKGNLVLVSELRRRGVDPMAVRLALLANHYRDDWSWTDALLASAVERLVRWREAVRRPFGADAGEVLVQLRAALANDLDAPTALAAVDAWVGASSSLQGPDSEAPRIVSAACDALLGVRL